MPHLILECNSALRSEIDFKALFDELHELLALQLPTQITSCKSRVYFCDETFIGQNLEQASFVHLTIKILAGRTHEIKKKVGVDSLNLLQRHLLVPGLSLSVEILDLNEVYFKR